MCGTAKAIPTGTDDAGCMDTTVVVIGAGLAGLTAARELRRAGVDVLVLEAAERPGGRALAETSALGSRLDLGGQWIGHDHERLKALAAEFGATAFVMHSGAVPAVLEDGRRVPLARPWAASVLPALLGVALLGRISAAPSRWADVPLDRWLRRVPGRRARRLLEITALTSWTADLDRFSVGAMRTMLRSQGGLKTMLSSTGGAQDSLLVEGAGTLAERLALELGERVRLGRAVVAIVQDDEGVTVRTAAGEVRAAKVVVTVPPPVAARIAHEPPLPAARAALEQTTEMGTVYKAIAVYERPFWRGRAPAEVLVLDEPGFAAFDTSPPDGPGHLCVLASGPGARALDDLDEDTRRRAILGPLAAHYGPPAATPVSWHEKAWHRDEHAGGGYIAVPLLGTTEGFPPMASPPFGHVHWAGSETARDHPGYLDGAIESGQRAAREVAEALPPRVEPTAGVRGAT